MDVRARPRCRGTAEPALAAARSAAAAVAGAGRYPTGCPSGRGRSGSPLRSPGRLDGHLDARSSSAAGVGTCTPCRRKASTTRARRSRPTSNCLPGSVRATMRTLHLLEADRLDAHDARGVEQQGPQHGVGEGFRGPPRAASR